ncbi:MAG TPA: TonB-dependent receptor [Longimicrobiaceae bacterium]
MLVLVALLFSLPLASDLQAQETGVLMGRVIDSEGAPIASASIRVGGSVALSDQDGYYRVSALPAGVHRVVAERLGYERTVASVSLAPGATARLDLVMQTETVELEGVVVDAIHEANRERARFETDAGVTARVIGGEELKALPGLGEADVMRAVEVLPGVVSTSDFSSAFNVRGGSADQNLILLDGFPIFNPFHLGGLFSVFNSDAIARAELLAGGFGAAYGGRVSSVLSVETRSAGVEGLEVEGGISMLATRVQLRSRLPDRAAQRLGVKSGGWIVSGRRSYFDQILKPVVDFPYFLTDFQGSGHLELAGGGTINLVAYGGADVLDLSDFDLPGDDSTAVLRVRWNWGNRLVGVRWRQPLSHGWSSDARIGYSRFADQLGFVDFEGAEFISRVAQVSASLGLSRPFAGGGAIQLGASAERLAYDNLAQAGGTPFYAASDHGILGAAYAALSLQPGDRWLVEPGVRLDVWNATGDNYVVLSPRFAVKRFLDADREAAVKLAMGRYSQFLHSLRDESLPVSNDTWIVAGRGAPVLISDQIQAGVEKYWGDDWSASLEAYYRDFDGVVEFNLADDPNVPYDDVLAGSGRSAGVDLLVRKNSGSLTGWATISYLRAERTLPDPMAEGWEDVPPEVTFPPVFDRRIDVDLVLRYLAPHGLELGARWNYGSPLPYTRPVAQYYAWRYSPLRRQYEPLDQPGDGPPLFVRLGDRNAERYPPYHRLDLTVRRTFERRWGSWTPYLQILNAYNRRNVLWYYFNYDESPPTRSGLSMFPILPAVGVEMSF